MQSGREKKINWAVFFGIRMSACSQGHSRERGVCAEQIQLPSDPRGFSVWLEGSEVIWIGTLENTKHQVLLCIGRETEA